MEVIGGWMVVVAGEAICGKKRGGQLDTQHIGGRKREQGEMRIGVESELG